MSEATHRLTVLRRPSAGQWPGHESEPDPDFEANLAILRLEIGLRELRMELHTLHVAMTTLAVTGLMLMGFAVWLMM